MYKNIVKYQTIKQNQCFVFGKNDNIIKQYIFKRTISESYNKYKKYKLTKNL